MTLDHRNSVAAGGRIPILAAAGAYVLAGLLTLARVPLVWQDEPWYTQPAWSFATNGTFAEPMFPGLHGLDISNVAYGRIYEVSVATAFTLFGVGPLQARLISFLAGLVVIGFTYLIGRRLWNATAGAIAAVVLAVSPVFVFQTHDARPEILQLAFTVAALWALLRSEDGHRERWLFGAGLLSALAADVHVNGVIAPLTLGAFILVRGGRPLLGRPLAAFVTGVFSGAMWWLAVHVLPDPRLFLDQWSHYWAPKPPLLGVTNELLTPFLGEVDRYARATLQWWDGAWLLPMVAILAVWIVRRHHPDLATTALVAAASVHVVAMGLIVPNKTAHYAVLVWPFLALFVGRWADVALGARVRTQIVLGVVAASLLALASTTIKVGSADYAGYIARLRAFIPESAIVQGEPTLWFGFADEGYVADHYFKAAGPYGLAVRRLGVTHILIDEFFAQRIVGVSVDRAEVQQYLDDHATLIGVVHDRFYGSSDLWGAGDYVTKIYEVRR
jgi:4-amino-4-deoxy-L-arabinose transferase-like glycosyltransferase